MLLIHRIYADMRKKILIIAALITGGSSLIYAVEPIELPPAELNENTNKIDSLGNLPEISGKVIERVEKDKVEPLTGESLPDGYGFMIFSSAPLPEDKSWWQNFQDPVLTKLELLALRNNYNVKAMLKRVEAAKQILKVTQAGYYPNINIGVGYNANRDSGRESAPYATAEPVNYFMAQATMSWEIDIFGKIYEKTKGDKANIDVTRLESEGLQLSLTAEIATYYSSLRMYEQQLDVARSHLKSQEDILNIVETRYKTGLVSKLDVAQAKNMVSSTRLLIPRYRAQLTSARNALATLCGVNSADLDNLIGNGDMPHLMTPIDVGVPADLIRRRPDVAEAERRISVLASQLGVAKKEYLPALTLDATIATHAHDPKYFFGDHSLTFTVAPTLSWNVFDGFARKAGIAEAKAEMEAQIETYNYTLITAVQEVEDAMQQYEAAGRELTLYNDVLDNSNEVVKLLLERYRHGLTDFTDVANAQITYLQNHTNYQSARANLFNSIVRLYKSLGGGFPGLK